MAEEATKTPLDDSKDRLREAKDERKIAKDRLSKAEDALVKVRRTSQEVIATAKKQHAVAKMEARIREDKERLERLPREDWRQLMLYLLLKVKIAYLERRSDWTRQTAERLGKGTGQLDESRKRIEDEQKDVENRLEDKEREEQAAIKDVEKKQKDLDALTDERNKKVAQAAEHICEVWKNVREKRRAVRMAASDVNSEALKFPWKRVANNIKVFGKWAGFAGVAGCFYASAVSLGAIFQFFYFRSNGVNIFSYAESVDFLAPGYGLVAFFILTAVSGSLIPLALYHLVKLIATHPLCAERVVWILPLFAKRITKSSIFVLFCSLFPLPAAAWLGSIWPPSQDVVRIVTNSPFQHDVEKYVRVGSTSKYLFLKQFDEKKGQADGQTSSRKNPRLQAIMARLGTILDLPQTTQAEDSDSAEPPKPETVDSKSDAGILVVPLSQITCISETTGNGEGLCRPAAVKSPPTVEDLVTQHIVGDMRCRAGTKLVTSDFVPFVYNKGDEIAECAGTQPRSKEEWKQKIQEFVHPKNDKARKATKWRVYGLASLDGDSAENDDLSRQRAETVRDMMCAPSETSSGIENCQEKVEIRYLGENHLVTAGPKSRSAVIAVCVPAPEQSPEKTTTPARKPVPSSG